MRLKLSMMLVIIIRMSEYFRRYIKREHYPNPPYSEQHSAPISNSKPASKIVFMTRWYNGSGDRPGTMIGT